MAQRGVDCINIADSPLARIRMSAMALAYQIHAHFPRLEIILHFTTRDRNLDGPPERPARARTRSGSATSCA